MSDLIPVVTSADATPLEMKLARVIRDNLAKNRPDLQTRQHQGAVNLISSTTPFNVTISVLPDKVMVRRGTQENAKISLSGDLAAMDNPTVPFKQKRHWRHPRFARFVQQLIRQELRPWRVAAEEFFECVHEQVDVDISVKVKSEGEDRYFEWGSGSESVLISSSSTALQRLFDKQSILIEELVRGNIHCHSSIRTTALLSELTLNRLLGGL
jgi:hypothetical protein